MKITGNKSTIQFEVESPDEVPTLKAFADKFGGYAGSYANEDRSVTGIEVSTKALFDIVQDSPGSRV